MHDVTSHFEIVKNSLYKIAEEMRVVLAKTARALANVIGSTRTEVACDASPPP